MKNELKIEKRTRESERKRDKDLRDTRMMRRRGRANHHESFKWLIRRRVMLLYCLLRLDWRDFLLKTLFLLFKSRTPLGQFRDVVLKSDRERERGRTREREREGREKERWEGGREGEDKTRRYMHKSSRHQRGQRTLLLSIPWHYWHVLGFAAEKVTVVQLRENTWEERTEKEKREKRGKEKKREEIWSWKGLK